MTPVLKILLIVALMTTIAKAELELFDGNYYSLDLQNFKFFKYPPRTRNNVQEPSATDHAFAVFDYLRSVVLGHPSQKNTYQIKFDQEKAERLRPAYEKQFGKFGKNLVALIGNGHSPRELRFYGAIGRDFNVV